MIPALAFAVFVVALVVAERAVMWAEGRRPTSRWRRMLAALERAVDGPAR